MNILIINAANPLGWSIANFLNRELDCNINIIASNKDNTLFYDKSVFDSANLFINEDIYSRNYIKKIIYEVSPDIIINSTFFNDINNVNNEKNKYWNQIVGLNEIIIRSALVTGSHFITFSSENVFNGLNGPYYTNVNPEPTDFYGKCYLAVENLLRSVYDKSTVIRITNYYGYTPYGFGYYPDKIMNEKNIKIFSNYFTNPVFLDDIAIAVYKIIEKKIYGLLNASGKDYLSLLAFANSFISYMNLYNSCFTIEDRLEQDKFYGLVNLETETKLPMQFSNLYDGISSLRYLFNLDME